MKLPSDLERRILEQSVVTGTVKMPRPEPKNEAGDYTSFDLPLPPSANLLWRIAGKRLVKSQAYRDWLEEVSLTIKSDAGRVETPVEIEFHLIGKVFEGRDGDNFVKPSIDAVVALGVIPSDNLKHVRKHSFAYHPEEEGTPRLLVIVRHIRDVLS